METANLYRVILPVPDIERATAFYGAVLGSLGRRVSPGRHYFNCGNTILACYDPIADGDGEHDGWRFHPFQFFYFAVPDLETVLARVQKAGGSIDAGIKTMPWGERVFYARDPFGSRISFVDARTLFTGQER
jgi:predicted enzyme related to lactoylglutathione lyase